MDFKNFEFPIMAIGQDEYEAVQEWIKIYQEIVQRRSLYIFGAGIRGNMFLKIMESAGIHIEGFCDSSKEKQGGYIGSYKIYAPDEICNIKNYIVISSENSKEIEKYLIEKGYEKGINYFVINNNVYSSYINKFLKKKDIDYLLFGDCFFTDVDIEDLNGITMGNLAEQELGREKTKVLSLHGMCIPSFYHLMRIQLINGVHPKSVAFIVNVPFCDGIQTKLPQSQHFEMFEELANKIEIRDDFFAEYVALVKERTKNINAKAFFTKKNISMNVNENIEKLLTKSRYMYEFKRENENILYMEKLIDLLHENQIKAVPFIPALNYSIGEQYFGDEFLHRYSKICQSINEIVSEKGIELLDMSYLLDDSDFSGKRMTKFPNARGKEKVIAELKKQMMN